MRASPIKSVSVLEEKNKGPMEHLRRPLFTSHPAKTANYKEAQQKIENPYEEVGVTELLNSLEKVQVGSGQPTRYMKPMQITKEKEQLDEAQQHKDTESRYLNSNVLHPTTKTLSSNLSHDTIPAKKPSDKPTNHSGSQKPEPKISMTDPPRENLFHCPTLTPLETLAAMVKHTQQPSTLQNPTNIPPHPSKPLAKITPPPQKPLTIIPPPSQKPLTNATPTPTETTTPLHSGGGTTKERETANGLKLKTWNRLVLKTPKIEGEPVLMGKRIADADHATPKSGMSERKKLKQGKPFTPESTAEAANQPRRSP